MSDSLFYVGRDGSSATWRADSPLQLDDLDMLGTTKPEPHPGDVEVDDLDALFIGFWEVNLFA
ncbi:hypothetical protein LTR41_012019, partial [Exophiala xenobiotica]